MSSHINMKKLSEKDPGLNRSEADEISNEDLEAAGALYDKTLGDPLYAAYQRIAARANKAMVGVENSEAQAYNNGIVAVMQILEEELLNK